jgi:hypothetical protein
MSHQYPSLEPAADLSFICVHLKKVLLFCDENLRQHVACFKCDQASLQAETNRVVVAIYAGIAGFVQIFVLCQCYIPELCFSKVIGKIGLVTSHRLIDLLDIVGPTAKTALECFSLVGLATK